MIDLDRAFRSLDEVAAPDLTERAYRLAEAETPRPGGVDLSRPSVSGPRRIAAGLVAAAVFAAAAFFAWQAFRPLRDGRLGVGPSPSVGSSDPWADVGKGWTELPAPPVAVPGAALVWSGSHLILWGGEGDAPTTPFLFDPVSSAWSVGAPAPFPMVSANAFWTGTEVLFWGGWHPSAPGPRMDGLAYDPVADTWRPIAAAPLEAGDDDGRLGAAVWIGDRLMVFGGGGAGDRMSRQGALYDPVADTWSRTADAPIGLNQATAVWTGTEAIVFGSLLNGNNAATTDHAVGLAYDPAADTWREIAPSHLSPQASSAVWLDGGMFAWDYEPVGAWYDAGTDTWGETRELPFRFSECYPDSLPIASVVFAWYCGQAAFYETVTGDWTRVTGGMTDATIDAGGQELSLLRFATLAGAGDVVAMVGEGITVDAEGIPCYGCPGSPTAFWAYRPPDPTPTAAELAPPTFAAADEWVSFVSSTDPSVVDPQLSPFAWSANGAFADEDLAGVTSSGALTGPSWPVETLRRLPPNGIVFVVSVAPTWVYSCCDPSPSATLPLQVGDATGGTDWEGRVGPNVSLFTLLRHVDGRDVEVRIFFGTPEPGEALFSEAQTQLDRLAIPPVPPER